MEISGKTTLYGIIGWPVAHSLSPWFQNDFLRQAGMDGVYVPFPTPPEQLAAALEGLHAAGVAGLNVTVPHKESLLEGVRRDAEAAVIGAVNTLRRTADGWEGTNTDWRGVQWALRALGTESPAALAERDVLVFGAGGTARAVLRALAGLGARRVWIANRTGARVDALIRHAAAHWPALHLEPVSWARAAVAAAARRAWLLVNTTSIGLETGQRFPFDLPGFAEGSGVAMDAVYRPDGRTAFLDAAVARSGMDGLPMLVAQGAASFAWWHGCGAPDVHQALHAMERRLGRHASAQDGDGEADRSMLGEAA